MNKTNNIILGNKGKCTFEEGCKNDMIHKRGIDQFFDILNNVLNIDDYSKSKINLAFKLSQNKFFFKNRNNGENYFTHLVEVAKIVSEFPNLTIDKILIALLHDIIEDTNVDFATLETLFGTKVAIAVQALSKEKIVIYKEIDLNFVNEAKVLKENGKIKDEIKEKNKNGTLKGNEKEALKIYLKYKKERNEKYFSRFKSLESIHSYIKIRHDKKVKNGEIKNELSNSDLEEISKDCLDVKFADRIHNLSTQWEPNYIKKVKRKIKQTKNHFLESAERYNKKAFDLLTYWINYLEDEINKSIDNTSSTVVEILETNKEAV